MGCRGYYVGGQGIRGGTLTAGGQVHVKTGAPGSTEVRGNIVATGSVILEDGSIVRGDVTSLTSTVVVKKDVQVIDGNVWAAGDVTLGKDVLVNGNVVAGGTVTVDDGVQVTGTVTAPGGILGAGAGGMQPAPQPLHQHHNRRLYLRQPWVADNRPAFCSPGTCPRRTG